jgi:hypothetical protein
MLMRSKELSHVVQPGVIHRSWRQFPVGTEKRSRIWVIIGRDDTPRHIPWARSLHGCVA